MEFGMRASFILVYKQGLYPYYVIFTKLYSIIPVLYTSYSLFLYKIGYLHYFKDDNVFSLNIKDLSCRDF